MLGHAREEDLAAFKVNEKQHIEPKERHGVDVEEIACQCAGGLGA
jgi:hypothetical protein